MLRSIVPERRNAASCGRLDHLLIDRTTEGRA
jgi:hypothetical protein